MPRPTRTIGPLHFEDLDPRRFEDLVRALLYDFRPWLKLEGTGRGGRDGGYDARGWEAPPQTTAPIATEPDGEEDAIDFLADAHLWLIQCKREKAIGPKKLKMYLDSISKEQRSELDALLFAAACDFTKTARDVFRAWCVAAGIGEYHLWGKADLEDILMQPKNDGILFSFFGISLTLRKRSLRTEVRARLATKKKIAKLVGQVGSGAYFPCLFRDPSDDRYPNVPEGTTLFPTAKKFGYNWFVRFITEVRHDGIVVQFRARMAYLADDGVHWDSIKWLGDQAIPDRYENPWEHPEEFETEIRMTRNARAFWQAMPQENQAMMTVDGFISYDDILAIDEGGDGIARAPTIFVLFDSHHGPFADMNGLVETLARDRWTQVNAATQVEYFPAEFADAPAQPSQLIDDAGEISPDSNRLGKTR